MGEGGKRHLLRRRTSTSLKTIPPASSSQRIDHVLLLSGIGMDGAPIWAINETTNARTRTLRSQATRGREIDFRTCQNLRLLSWSQINSLHCLRRKPSPDSFQSSVPFDLQSHLLPLDR